jgi:hypothetical protein
MMGGRHLAQYVLCAWSDLKPGAVVIIPPYSLVGRVVQVHRFAGAVLFRIAGELTWVQMV